MKTIYSALAVMLICGGVAQGAFAADAAIGTSGVSFTPADVTIDAGDTVTWSGLASGHNVAQSASAGSNFYDGSGFISGAPSAVNTYQHTFNTPGIFYFLCEPHADFGMKGSVTVQAVSLPATDFAGLALLLTVLTGACFRALRHVSHRES